MKPSERIDQILREYHNGDINYLSVAIERYLDEQYEQEQKNCEELKEALKE